MAQPQSHNRFRPQGRSAELRIAILGGVSCWCDSHPELGLWFYPRRGVNAYVQRFGPQPPGTKGVQTGPLARERQRIRGQAQSALSIRPVRRVSWPGTWAPRRSIAGACAWTGMRSFSSRAAAWRTYPGHLRPDGPAADSMRSVAPRSESAEGGRCQSSRGSPDGGCAQKQPLLTLPRNLWVVECRRPHAFDRQRPLVNRSATAQTSSRERVFLHGNPTGHLCSFLFRFC